MGIRNGISNMFSFLGSRFLFIGEILFGVHVADFEMTIATTLKKFTGSMHSDASEFDEFDEFDEFVFLE
jgi:hypothetical protein